MNDAEQPARKQPRSWLQGHGVRRWVVFGVIVLLVIVWIAAVGEDHDALARSFLRNLLRHLR